MARVIKTPREQIMKCPNCFAEIGYDNSDIETSTLYPPIDYYKITERYKPIYLHKLICPYCSNTIYLNERCEDGLGN